MCKYNIYYKNPCQNEEILAGAGQKMDIFSSFKSIEKINLEIVIFELILKYQRSTLTLNYTKYYHRLKYLLTISNHEYLCHMLVIDLNLI